jgi:hypothetical protein
MALWACIIGESGSRKTPGLRTVTRTMDRIEKDNRPLHISAAQKHQERVEWFKAEFKRWKKLCAAAIAEGNEPPAMPIDLVDPGAFIWPALYVSDCTAPRLARLCNVRPRGMLQIRDELAALFSSMKAAGSRALYLEAWVGERFVFERVDDRKSFVVEHLLVGLVGGFQPDKLARVFAGDEDGFYGRFLFGWPLAPSYAPLSSDIGEVDPDFQAVLQKLIWLPAEDENNEFAPRIVPISDDARAVFENYRKFVDRTKRSVEGRELQWLAKSETHVLRLAGTLSYLSWASMTSRSGLESITGGLLHRIIPDKVFAN